MAVQFIVGVIQDFIWDPMVVSDVKYVFNCCKNDFIYSADWCKKKFFYNFYTQYYFKIYPNAYREFDLSLFKEHVNSCKIAWYRPINYPVTQMYDVQMMLLDEIVHIDRSYLTEVRFKPETSAQFEPIFKYPGWNGRVDFNSLIDTTLEPLVDNKVKRNFRIKR